MMNSAVARILTADGQAVGAGVLFETNRILTCAHVISHALRISVDSEPNATVQLDFPLSSSRRCYQGRVISWHSEEGHDLAVLQLHGDLQDEIMPVRLIADESKNLWGHTFRTYGFPRRFELGVWSAGKVLGPTGTNDWLQIEAGQEIGYRIVPGFSGSPVWDESLGGVVGLVAATDVQSRAAFVITTAAIASIIPEISFVKPSLLPPKPSRRLKVFLCHASDDKPAVRDLYRRLRNDGTEPWLDEQDLLPGQRWQLEIPKAVRSSDAVLVLLSSNSVTKSGYVQKEIKTALDAADEQPDDRLFLIPVRLEDCEIPDRLTPFQWVNLFDDAGYDRLLRSLRRLADSIGIKIQEGPHRAVVPSEQLPPLVSILFLAADPTDTSRLRLGEELREIQEKLQLSKGRDRLELSARMSVKPADISQSLLDVEPQIVHFSGHGTRTGELCFEDSQGNSHLISGEALRALFSQFTDQVRCVILNACYSESQAQQIAKHVQYVIGTTHAIGDQAAIAFSVGFYQALGAGRSVEDAYQLGCAQIQLQGMSEHLTPILLKDGRLRV